MAKSSGVFSFKAIRPKKLNVDVFRKNVLNELRKEGTLQRKEFRKTVTGWKGKRPRFESIIGLSRGNPADVSVFTGPTGDTFGVQKWVWTDLGTKRHPIRARNSPTLRFQINFIPSTRPGWFGSTISASWPPWRAPFEVDHPGTKARNWSRDLGKARKKPFERRIFGAIKRASKNAFPG